MTTPPPIYCIWDGESMIPHKRFSRLAENAFKRGHLYRMVVEEERSINSHRQYFAAVNSAWLNLPESMQLAFPTPDHLRKYALIKAGFCDIQKISKIRPRIHVDGYAIVTEEDGITTVHTAKSQSYRTMGKAEFQRSKEAVLEVLAGMLDVTPDQLLAAKAA